MQHRNELREVLGEDERRRDRVRRLVVLAAHERRAVGDREEREADARDQERRGDRRVPGVAGERRRGEAERDGPAAARAPEQPQRRREQAARTATAAAKTISAGTSSRKALVPLPEASDCASIEPRAQPTSTTATAPSAAASSGVNASLPSWIDGARTAA